MSACPSARRLAEGKVALVTGAAIGLGRATALLLAREGARVFVADIDEAGGHDTVACIVADGGQAAFQRTDISRSADIQTMVERCVATYGRLDCAVNNAGIGGELNKTADYSEEGWHRLIAINLTGVFLGMKCQIPEMLKVGGGAIVNVGSTASITGATRMPAYTAAKHGLWGLTRTTAMDYGSQNVRVNAIFPGSFRTAMSEQLFGGDRVEKMMTPVTPLGRLGSVEEIAESIVWLCSDRASFVTGAGLSVDGGKKAG